MASKVSVTVPQPSGEIIISGASPDPKVFTVTDHAVSVADPADADLLVLCVDGASVPDPKK